MTEWRPVVGFEESHEVSRDGRVRSLPRQDPLGRKWPGKELRPRGRLALQVVLCSNGKVVDRKVHHLVLEAFVGPRPVGMECCHNNGDWRDNRVENLRWDTKKANANDRFRHGTALLGERHPRSKLKDSDIREIRAMRNAGMTHRQIGNVVGVSHFMVGSILRGRNWTHVE